MTKQKLTTSTKMFLCFACVSILLLVAKFYIGFYDLNNPPLTSFFIKHQPIWKSTFYSPLNRDNKTYADLNSAAEKYEQSMFIHYASKQVLNDLGITKCGDLFSRFATKPKHLEYLGCEHFSDSQTIISANYRVAGKNAIAVENFLIKNYHMPPMKIFRHTGYEPAGFGVIEFDMSKTIEPYLGIYIDMGGYARKEPTYDAEGKALYDFTLLAKEEVPYFYVTVKIMVI